MSASPVKSDAGNNKRVELFGDSFNINDNNKLSDIYGVNIKIEKLSETDRTVCVPIL